MDCFVAMLLAMTVGGRGLGCKKAGIAGSVTPAEAWAGHDEVRARLKQPGGAEVRWIASLLCASQ
jgi:hypothetical protein